MYRVQLNSDVVKCVGGFECLVNKSKQGNNFILIPCLPGVDENVKRTSKITSTYTLNIPKRLVDEWNDLGKYELEFDYENNCVELIKI